jgi:low temperature requirement protein LtrA
MATTAEEGAQRRRLSAALRGDERVRPLELFFDLVFVLALTQCTTLMANHPTWEGLEQGLLVLAVLWWSWGGYAWLTSVLDPEEGAVRLVMFAAMASFLIAALCVPNAFGDLALEFAVAYGFVRIAHIGLFILASRDDHDLRRSVLYLAVGMAIGVSLLAAASAFDGSGQIAVWILALALDVTGPYFFGSEGWKLVPHHFAERYGLIIIIALGESIVAIGAGASGHLTAGITAAAVLGIAVVAAMWWMYFDIVAIVSARRLAAAPAGRVQNELARDSYTYMHFPMAAGIILLALGLKLILHDVDEELDSVIAFATLGGVALYLLGLVGFRFRHVHTISKRRLGLAIGFLVVVPLATVVPPLTVLAAMSLALGINIASETRMYGEGRVKVRHGESSGPPAR